MLWLDVDEEELLNKGSETDGVIIGGGALSFVKMSFIAEVTARTSWGLMKLKILPDNGFDTDGALVRSITEGFSSFSSNSAKKSSSARSNSVQSIDFGLSDDMIFVLKL